MQPAIPSFDIFRGPFPSRKVEWLESVEGLASAVSRMKEIAAKTHGPYFVFNAEDRRILASIDTTYSGRAFKPSRHSGAA